MNYAETAAACERAVAIADRHLAAARARERDRATALAAAGDAYASEHLTIDVRDPAARGLAAADALDEAEAAMMGDPGLVQARERQGDAQLAAQLTSDEDAAEAAMFGDTVAEAHRRRAAERLRDRDPAAAIRAGFLARNG